MMLHSIRKYDLKVTSLLCENLLNIIFCMLWRFIFLRYYYLPPVDIITVCSGFLHRYRKLYGYIDRYSCGWKRGGGEGDVRQRLNSGNRFTTSAYKSHRKTFLFIDIIRANTTHVPK